MPFELRQRADDPLNLGSLPMAEPPGDGWPAVEAALRQRNRRRAMHAGGGLLAVAASAVLAFSLLLGTPGHHAAAPGADPAAAAAASTDPQTEAIPAPLRAPSLESLIAMSRQLEDRIRSYRAQSGDLPSDVLVYQVELQDLIVQVDEELSMKPDSPALWAQRVNLLLDVTQLYENSLRRDYYRMASL
ncbi:MAG: hypothetical protein P8Y54_13385 [Xanthomonadales bacterium]